MLKNIKNLAKIHSLFEKYLNDSLLNKSKLKIALQAHSHFDARKKEV